ncbi:MAG: hypothetical protein VYA54_05580 [Bdellovibrionota bacterium]|nr:hypothetical protein [Bdellovibrionota bacterium]
MPILLVLFTFLSLDSFAKEYTLMEETVVFPGRVSRVNPVAKLVRLKIDFENAKFLNKNNRIEIWNESFPERRCLTYLEGRTNDYLLVRIPEYNKCRKTIYFTTGSYLHMYSPDLENSLITAKELVQILQRKHMALNARLTRYQSEVDGYIEKVDVVNKRFEVLRQKLELEWQRELADLEEDKTRAYQNFKETQARLNDLEFKLRKYRVRDQNLQEDRWSLDPKLYYKK